MKKAVFLDRDGTLVHEVGYLKMIEDLRFTARAPEALRIFHDLGYLNIVVTNQSAVARGILSPKVLRKIHQKMKELASYEDGIIDDIFVCPHYAEGRVEPYNIDCECRKPKPGLIRQAVQKHHLDLSQCILVGDQATDLGLGLTVGVRTILVLTGYGQETKAEWEGQVETYPNLYDFALSLKDTNGGRSNEEAELQNER